MFSFKKSKRVIQHHFPRENGRKGYILLETGFTLVELLVVIAIIAILSTFTLVAIGSYQDKANDTVVEADLSQLRKVSVLLYIEDNSYLAICDSNDTINDGSTADYGKALESIETSVEKILGPNTITCHSDMRHYCVQAQLISDGYFCVDSTGFARKVDGDYCKNKDGKRNCLPK